MTGAPNNLGLDPFPDPIGHFWAPWRPFWISSPLIGQNTRSAWIKKLIYQQLTGAPNNLGLDPFPDHVAHFWAPWRPFWISRPSFLFSVVYFSHRRSVRIKKLGVDPFPDPGGHFGAPWRPFWIFEVLIEGVLGSKNLFSER